MFFCVLGLQCSDNDACNNGLDSSFVCCSLDANKRLDCVSNGHVNEGFSRNEDEMSVLYIALPVALLLGGSALLACLVCIRSGQYDDLETPSVKLLNDELKQ